VGAAVGDESLPVRTDVSWQRPTRAPADGLVVVAGSPLRLFRLSPGGAHVIAQAEQGAVPGTGAIRQLVDRFVEAGALHPQPERGPFTTADVTVVIPCHDGPPLALARHPGALAGVCTIVVDDASARPVEVPAMLAGAGLGAGAGAGADEVGAREVRVVRRAANGGPAAARNTGLAEVVTQLVAFVDADVALPDVAAPDDWLGPLLAHFADQRVALVAPRVVSGRASEAGASVADYEQRHTPLDLGPHPARIAAGTRVSYVPAAALVCRTEAVRTLGGFDEAMRVGEDVDLVWRVASAGHRCRYEPTVVVEHAPRSTWGLLLRQRFGYGRSAAPLAARHAGALAPVRMSGWSALVWALVAARRPLAAMAVAAGTAVALVRRLADVPPALAARLVARGHLAAGRQFARALRREWWPLAVVAALVSRRARRTVIVAAASEALVSAYTLRSPRALADAPAALADDMAYGAGVWAGVLREREWGPLRAQFSSWPGRSGG
jgi:mycofactocin system glycosyltransferase